MISFLLHQSNYSFLTIGDLLTSTSPHRHFTRNYKILCLIITVFTKYVQNRHYHWFLSKDLRQFQSDFHGKHCRTSVDSSGILVRQKSVLFVLSGTWFTACLGVRWVDAYTWTAFLRPRGGVQQEWHGTSLHIHFTCPVMEPCLDPRWHQRDHCCLPICPSFSRVFNAKVKVPFSGGLFKSCPQSGKSLYWLLNCKRKTCF